MKKKLISCFTVVFSWVMIFNIMLAGVVWVPTSVHATTQATYYVSPTGSDSNPGTSSQPFMTIEKARDVVRTINSNMTGDIYVKLKTGVYPVTNTIAFNETDSGTNGYNIYYQADTNANPIISGGQKITNWTLHDGANNVYKASVGTLNFRQLYVNGKPAVRSRTPNTGKYNKLLSWDTTNKRIQINASEYSSWGNLNQVEMVVQKYWGNDYLRIGSATTVGSAVYVTPQSTEQTREFVNVNPQKANNQPYHFENAYEFIDQESEWYVDTSAQTLYYKPRNGENMSSVEVYVPTVQTLVSIQGSDLNHLASNIVFDHVTFQHSTWMLPSSEGYIEIQSQQYYNGLPYKQRPPAAVYLKNGSNNSFSNCTFSNMGSVALDVHRGESNTSIVGNKFNDIAGNGIMIGVFEDSGTHYNPPYNPTNGDAVTGALINNNFITRVGQSYYGAAGILAGYIGNSEISNNEVVDTPWSGISVGWGWNTNPSPLQNILVQNNHIYNAMNLLCDGGGIYMVHYQPGTQVTNNYIHQLSYSLYSQLNPIAGIYLDMGSKGMTVENNVLSGTSNGNQVFVQTGVPSGDNTIANNYTDNDTIENSAGLTSSYIDVRRGVDYNASVSKSATASTYDSGHPPFYAIDGTNADYWGVGTAGLYPWHQTDLGKAYIINQIQLFSRAGTSANDLYRKNFEVRASNDPTFSTSTLLDSQGATAWPAGEAWIKNIADTNEYRYIRVIKTDSSTFYLNEVIIFGREQ
ncbi:hypothetical protein GC102_07450 [Paenibacillus sp. LMG 31460]|uniref:F5/8 type C domain-containing protein n=1 Tax=Paenibacillus germinis TaxID=2654979 RepID=A0ABX1Z0Y4_9BACL|nr:discoidin domain-containing protein [Paenibacillus germinis]NOU85613.1 hypothetical protein [Paenibacillus germinis]